MTTYRCIGCGCELLKDDGKNETIKGLCAECGLSNPGLVHKVPVHYGRDPPGHAWRRYG